MDEEHSDTKVATLKSQHGTDDKTAKMVHTTIDGDHLQTKTKLFFIKFSGVCHSSEEYKDALVAIPKNTSNFKNSYLGQKYPNREVV